MRQKKDNDEETVSGQEIWSAIRYLGRTVLARAIGGSVGNAVTQSFALPG